MENTIFHSKQLEHPCFDVKYHFTAGRIHLPVAPACNIQCRFCSRKYDCANENRPGVTSRVISPSEALELVEQTLRVSPYIRVAGIAGPGDPLANPATFETFELIDRRFPALTKCMSTNGLLLPDCLQDLKDIKLDTLTVTVNALNPATGAAVYASAGYRGQIYHGEEAAALLFQNQMAGIEQAVRLGLRVKVNCVLIPGVNEAELPDLAARLKQLGVNLMNIIPLIPQAEMAALPPVSPAVLNAVRLRCEKHIGQFRHCRQCRADAVGIPGLENRGQGCLAGALN